MSKTKTRSEAGNDVNTARTKFYDRISKLNVSPLWEVLQQLVPPEPISACRAAQWRFEDMKPFLLEASEHISTEEAERRVLILENPGLRGQSRITSTLYGGLQIILPGEIAPTHRHSQSALRFVLEGNGAYTSVEGEDIPMSPGDLVITPSWFWHQHGNNSSGPMIWFDCLDIPLVSFFEAEFAERLSEGRQLTAKPDGISRARFGTGLVPIDHKPNRKTSPLLHYPYRETRQVLNVVRDAGPPDSCHGYKLRYTDPMTGGHITPTMAAFLQLLPKTLCTEPYRCTGSTVFIAIEGRGRTCIGNESFAWRPNDTFVVPSWVPHYHEADEDSVLFSYSDQGVLEALDLWREEKIN